MRAAASQGQTSHLADLQQIVYRDGGVKVGQVSYIWRACREQREEQLSIL